MSGRWNIFSTRKIVKRSSNSNEMSLDSLEEGFKNKTSIVDTISDDNLETIAVPFYENDVLVKVPKEIRKEENNKPKTKLNRDHASSYLVNKNKQSKRSSSYLEKFRKQFLPNHVENKPNPSEIRSLSPEVGDTDRSICSFGVEGIDNPVEEFQNTEAYNEIYYETLLQQAEENYGDHSSDEGICFNDELDCNNLRSVSEVSQPRRHRRRVTMEPMTNVKLGGLGPDLEVVRPQIIRAKSVQRYSERVRAANRVSIYKKTVTEEQQNKKGCELKNKKRLLEQKASYLMNKSSEKTLRKNEGSTSANTRKMHEALASERVNTKSRLTHKRNTPEKPKNEKNDFPSGEDGNNEKKLSNDSVEVRVKSSARYRTIKTEIKPKSDEVPPIHISFLVNVENSARPPSTLRRLEEKHRHYQEMVKQYVKDFS